MFKKILLAADGSTHSLRAAEKAIELAKLQAGVTLEVIYVVDGNTSKADVLHNLDPIDTAQRRRDKMALIEKKANRYGIQYQINILRGEPGPTIVKHANTNDYDLVVIGSRGLNMMQEMVLGSVSHKVAKRVHCPVLIVK